MTELIAKTPCDGLLPLSVGALTLSEVEPGALTTIAPFRGGDAALSDALEAAHGMAAPAPNRTNMKGEARALWFGHRLILLQGPAPDQSLAPHAALTDQSDGWAVLQLEGRGAADVLSRLVPLDLRDERFREGHTARTELRHMMASITRTGAQCYQIMVFRAFAATVVHDVKTAMKSMTARASG